MATRLRKLRIGKVALCFRGANQQAEVLLYKAAPVQKDEYPMDGDHDDAPPLTTLGRLRQRQLWQEWGPLWYAFNDSVHAMMDCDDGEDMEYAPLLLQSIAEFQSEAQRILTSLGLVGKAASFFAVCNEVTKAGAVMAAGRKQRLRDAIAALQAILDEAEPVPADSPTMKGAMMAETLKEAIERAEAAEAAHQAVKSANAFLEHENETLKASIAKQSLTPEQEEEAFIKSMPESFRKRWEADRELTKEALATATIEKEKRERQEYIEKTALYRHAGLTPDHHNILKAIDAMPEQERTELLRILKSASAVMKQGNVFVPQGSDGSGTGGMTAGDRAMAKAQALVADKSAATIQEALDTVLKADAGLYQEYQGEQRQQSRIK